MRRFGALLLAMGLAHHVIADREQGSDQSSAHADSDTLLLVMLQGDPLDDIRRAVTNAGARITHDLPIIGAIGAEMTRVQLRSLSDNPHITRVIDDLAYQPEPDLEIDDACPLAGGLQLIWTDATARWQLFNKGDDPLVVHGVEVASAAEVGSLRSVRFADRAVDISAMTSNGGTLMLGDETGHMAPHSNATLVLGYEHAPESAPAVQNAFSLRVTAGDNCEAELIPSYRAPFSDSYYPTVSGAALLQHHGVTGAGITVAVLDSGLWEDPAELALDTQGEQRVLARYDAQAAEEVDMARDESGHGTHMTSVIASSRAVTRDGALRPSYRGVAPDASLVVVKAFDSKGEAGFLDIVRGIQWVIENRERLNIRVLNLSFASRPRWPYWEDPVNQALMQAWKAGIVVIAAAGNEGPDPMTIGSPGNLPYLITVGAITDSWTEEDRRDDYLPDFSSRGPTPMGHIKPDIVTYGGHISGVMRPGATLGDEFPEYFMADGSFVMTGTSQAAAVVSGLAALLLEAEPDVSNDDIKCMLMSSAEPAITVDGRLAYSPFLQGSGLVNVSRAITVGDRGCGNEGLKLDEDLSGADHFQGPAVMAEDSAEPVLPGQNQYISETAPEKGMSDSRRWGPSAHLKRLSDPSVPSPIDWLGIYQSNRLRMESLAKETE